MNITDDILLQAAQQPDAIAIFSPSCHVTWAALERAVHSITNKLFYAGIRSGTVVALSMNDPSLSVAAMLSVARLGATTVSLPITDVLSIQAQTVVRTHATVLLCDEAIESVSELFESVLVLSTDEMAATASIGACNSPCDMNPQAPCFLIVGSGTTGRPKIMPIGHGIFKLRAEGMFERLAMTTADRLATVAKIDFWVSKLASLTALLHGVPIVLFDRQADLIEQCRDSRVTILFLSAVHLDHLVKQVPIPHSKPLDFLRVLNVGGALVTESLRRRTLKHLAACLHITYGTNEFGLVSMAGPDDMLSVSGSVGRPVKHVEVQIRDRDGEVLAQGQTGEIWLRSQSMISAYHNDPDASAREFVNGWFKPGDLGSITPSGQLVHYGRADHMMVVDGVNISPAEIENCLSMHPAVADASALPLQHPVYQHIPVCAVELHEGASVTEKVLMDFALAKIGSHCPERILILNKIPRNELGKIRRAELARQIAQALGIPVQG